jgi:glycosyltransferase involved in cell wall biosynthesis
MVKVAHVTVATSMRLREDISKHTSRVEYIPNGVRLDSSPRTRIGRKHRGRFTVGFVGSFGEWIDFDMILSVAVELHEVLFLLVGDGEKFEYVRNKSLGLGNVKLTGMVDRSGMPE